MKIVYLPFSKTVEDEILMALVRKNGEKVVIGENELELPTVVNVTGYPMPRLSQVLLRSYRELFELQTRDNSEPSAAAEERFVFRLTRVIKSGVQNGTDLLVVCEKSMDMSLLRDTLKKVLKGGGK
jgi:hypothetical protein